MRKLSNVYHQNQNEGQQQILQSWGAEILGLTVIQASNNEAHTQHAKYDRVEP